MRQFARRSRMPRTKMVTRPLDRSDHGGLEGFGWGWTHEGPGGPMKGQPGLAKSPQYRGVQDRKQNTKQNMLAPMRSFGFSELNRSSGLFGRCRTDGSFLFQSTLNMSMEYVKTLHLNQVNTTSTTLG